MSACKVISTGSQSGNSVALFNGEIVVDLGIKTTNKDLAEVLPTVKYILLTHEHGDHIHIPTLRYILKRRPSVKIIGGKWMQEYLNLKAPNEFRLDIVEAGKVYKYDKYIFSPFGVSHNVPNIGYHVYYIADKNTTDLGEKSFKTIYITDSGSYPNDLRAPDYHIYMLEMNYLESSIHEDIQREIDEIGFSHRTRSLEDHLSLEQSERWHKAQGGKGVVVPLHMSRIYADIIKERYGV